MNCNFSVMQHAISSSPIHLLLNIQIFPPTKYPEDKKLDFLVVCVNYCIWLVDKGDSASPWQLGSHLLWASVCPPQRCIQGDRRWIGQCSHSDQWQNNRKLFSSGKQRAFKFFTRVCVSWCTDDSQLVGRGSVLKQQVDNVGVALLSGLV